MKIRFDLKPFEPFSFIADGKTYAFPVKCLAERSDFEKSIHESVVETMDGKKIRLTVVGDEVAPSPFGVHHGWYEAQVLSEADAATALAQFSGQRES